MPRKAKDEAKVIEEKKVKKATNSKKSTTKKTTVKPTTKATKKTTTKATKASTTKKTSRTTTKSTKKVAPSKKVVTKNTATKKKTSSTKKTSNKKSIKNSIEIIEYYDLPYRYNQTVVKILAQTPSTLFVYWDISDEDKNNYINQYGEYFFNNTKPVLIITNITKNYTFEIDINDFANSWYLHIQDSNCDYKVELGRRPINQYVSIPNNYLYVSSSNNIESPNDHILFEELPHSILFKNVKTNEIIQRAIIHYLVKFEKYYNIKDFYKEMYKDENINFDKLTLNNPSSSSTFK